MKVSYFSFVLLGLATLNIATAQPPSQPPAKVDIPKAPVEQSASESAGASNLAPNSKAVVSINTRSVSSKSLMQQRLHSAVFPEEAELRCGVLTDCVLGLSYGMVLGADLFATATTTLLGQQFYGPGAWVFYDAFVGRSLKSDDARVFASAAIGYRGYSYRKEVGVSQEERAIKTSGFTFRLSYAQEINEEYSQGVNVSFFTGEVSADSPGEFRAFANGATYRKMMREFYSYSQQHPTLRVGFPADIELINWKASDIDLPNNLRGYARLEPFYIQNNLVVDGEFNSSEKNFGLRTMGMLSYESLIQKAGRMGFLVGVGFDIAGTNAPSVKYIGESPVDDRVIKEKLPARRLFTPVLNIEGSYKF